MVSHGLTYGGAQVSTIQTLARLKHQIPKIYVVVCCDADRAYVHDLENLGLHVLKLPYRLATSYADINIESVNEIVKAASLIWVTDEAYLVAPRVKKIKDVPVVAHVRSYALVCPMWSALCGLERTCLTPCTPWHLTKCKRALNDSLNTLGILKASTVQLYKALDLAKGPVDYLKWPIRRHDVIDSIDSFVFVSEATRDIHMHHDDRFQQRKHAVIYDAIEVPFRAISKSLGRKRSRRLSVFYAGGSQPVKGPHVCLETLRILVDRGLQPEATMLGCKGSWVEHSAQQLGLLIDFPPRLPSDHVYERIMGSSVVLFPSVWPEPLGRVVVEANLLGVPVVGSRTGGIPEAIIDGENGFLVEPGSAYDCANKIEQVWQQPPSSRARISQLARRNFDPSRETNRLLEFFQSFD